ncbi:MAG: hypothetical protein HY886_04310 [Deltaproteobacteria bacterium]|nr:hypothetical protein [Deltaproteobacteria bacterium]
MFLARIIGSRRLRIRTIVAVVMALLLYSSPAPAEETQEELKTVDADGFSQITGDNALIARDAAISDALRKAVEQAVGTFISAESVVENYQILSDNVYTKTQGYVKNYKVIGETQTQGLFKATVRATVAVGSIQHDLDALGLLMAKVEKPRVLFIVSEDIPGHPSDTLRRLGDNGDVSMPAAESAMKEIFLNKGFNVVDVESSADKVDVRPSAKSSGLTNDKAKRLGKALDAEIVVRVKAVARQGGKTPGSEVSAYLADISADAIRVDDARVMASVLSRGTARNISDVSGGIDAISKASGDAAEKLMDQIIAKWSKGNIIVIKLTGIAGYTDIVDIINMLKKEVRGTKAVYQRRFAGDEATLEVEANVPAKAIADALARHSKRPAKILKVTQNAIEAEFQVR